MSDSFDEKMLTYSTKYCQFKKKRCYHSIEIFGQPICKKAQKYNKNCATGPSTETFNYYKPIEECPGYKKFDWEDL